MELIKKIIKQSALVIVPLSLLSVALVWKSDRLPFVGLFGRPELLPVSIIVGGILGLANIKGLAWGITGLLTTEKPNLKIVLLNLFRLVILFIIIIILSLLKLINFLGLLIGITVVFFVLIKESLKMVMINKTEN